MTDHCFTEMACYHVVTTAGRVFDVQFRGYDKRIRRLVFVNIDAPFQAVTFKPRWIASADQIGVNR